MEEHNTEGPRVAAFRAAFRRSLVLVLALCLAGAVAGALLGAQRSQAYVAEASILIEPLNGNPFSPTGNGDDLVNLQTEAQLLKSDAVAGLVQSTQGLNTDTSTLLENLSVSVPPNTQILTIAYSSADRTTALSRAQAFATAYLDYREQRANTQVSNQSRQIDERIAKRKEEMADLAKKLGSSSGGSSQLLQQKIDSVATQINQLEASKSELQTGVTAPGQVITPASIPATGPLRPPVVFAVLGLVAGLGLALTVVVVRSRADNRIHYREDVTVSGLRLLGDITPGDAAAVARSIASEGDPTLSDAFKHLRVALLTGQVRPPMTVLLTSAAHEERSPVASVGLALATSRSQLQTVVVDATAGLGSGPATVLDVSAGPGLIDVLTGRTTLDTAMVTLTGGLELLPPGAGDADPDDLFVAPQMSELLGEMRKRADIVLLACPPVQQARTQALIGLADRVVVEAVAGVTTQRELLWLAEEDGATPPVDVIYVSGERTHSRSREVEKRP